MEEETNVSGEEKEVAAAPLEAEPETQKEQEQMVPLSALESERAKRQQQEEENRLYREHLLLMQSQNKTQQKQEPAKKGYDPNDVPTWGEVENYLSEKEQAFKASYEELRIQQKYPDYQEVITQHLPELFKTNPSLRDSLQRSQDYELAYYLAKNSDSYKTKNSRPKKSEEAERILKNTSHAGTLSSVGASTPVVQAKRYKDMTDEEFDRIVNKNLGY